MFRKYYRIKCELEVDSENLHAWETGDRISGEPDDSMLTYVVCFSEKMDCLSQWRGYADDGKGISIGFCKKMLESFPKWKEIKVGDMSFTEPTYRVSKGQLISYVELSFANVKSDFVKEIWIGPKSKIELRDIVHVLSRYGYYDEVDDYNEKNPILITRSSSSYR